MKLLFIFARPHPYDSVSVREKACGGTEKAVIFLGEALQKLGHTVEWITTPTQLTEYSGSPDVVITQIASLFENFPDAKKVWWTHHFSDQPVIQQNAAFARCFADTVVSLSRCHRDDLARNLRMESIVIGHGVWHHELGDCSQKDPHRLIYASTPFRGLEKIPVLFKAIKDREPRATIAVCSSMATYGESEKDAQYQKLFDELKDMPGVELKGALNQAQLYAEYGRASIFFYPCIWPETYCMAMDEAVAHGCLPITTGLAALARAGGYKTEQGAIDWVLNAFKSPNAGSGVRYHPVVREDDISSLIEHVGCEPRPRDWMDVARQWEAEVLA